MLKSIQYFQMKRSDVAGCCVGSYFYDLGNAHNHPRARSVDDFAFKLIERGNKSLNTAMTNSSQAVERGYLEACGFRDVGTQGSMHIHVATANELEVALKPYRVKYQAAMQAQQDEEQKKYEELRRKQEEDMKKKLEAVKSTKKGIAATAAEIRTILNVKPRDLTIKDYLRQVYGFKKPLTNYCANQKSSAFLYSGDFGNLAESINLRLKNEGMI